MLFLRHSVYAAGKRLHVQTDYKQPQV